MCMSGSCSSLNYIHLSSTLVSVPIYFLADQAWQVVPTFKKPEHPDMQGFYHTDWAAGAGQGRESCVGRRGFSVTCSGQEQSLSGLHCLFHTRKSKPLVSACPRRRSWRELTNVYRCPWRALPSGWTETPWSRATEI